MLKKNVVTIMTGMVNLTMNNGKRIIARSILDKKIKRKTHAASQVIKNMTLRIAGAIQNESILRMFRMK